VYYPHISYLRSSRRAGGIIKKEALTRKPAHEKTALQGGLIESRFGGYADR